MSYPSGCPVGAFSDVYTTLPSALGLALGQVAQDPSDMSVKQLVKAEGTVAQNAAVNLISTTYDVSSTTEVTDLVHGVNDNAGAAVADESYFWATIWGPCTPLVAAGVNAKITLSASANDGELKAAAAADANGPNIVTLAASGAGGATACFLR